MSHVVLNASTNVLVTGVTGLIGGEIVRRLALSGLGKVWALVRPRPEQDAAERFAERMRRSGEVVPAGALSAVEVLSGDIKYPRWNLSEADFARVTDSVDMIIHCAADTSFLCQDAVRHTNVSGTRNLIDLAGQCRRQPLVVYMSTATNIGKVSHRCLAEEEGCRPDNEHHNEYTRSKAIAELLVRQSGLPVLTLRPTIVMSSGLSDPEFAQNIVWFVPLLRRFECLPLDPDSRLDIVPVSFIVDGTVELLRKADRRYDCYHLSAGERFCVTVGQMNEYVNRYYTRRRPLRLVKPSEWTKDDYRAHVRSARQRKIFFGLRYYLPFLNMDVVYDNRRLQEEYGDRPLAVAPLTQYMGSLLEQITSRRALQEAARP